MLRTVCHHNWIAEAYSLPTRERTLIGCFALPYFEGAVSTPSVSSQVDLKKNTSKRRSRKEGRVVAYSLDSLCKKLYSEPLVANSVQR